MDALSNPQRAAHFEQNSARRNVAGKGCMFDGSRGNHHRKRQRKAHRTANFLGLFRCLFRRLGSRDYRNPVFNFFIHNSMFLRGQEGLRSFTVVEKWDKT
jgi:hypothetical protein